MSDLTTRSYHLEETTKDTRLLMVDNLYDEMNVLGGVRDCTAHEQLQEIADVWHGLNRFDQAILHRKWPELTVLLGALTEGSNE